MSDKIFFDVRRPKDKAGLVISIIMIVILFFALKPTFSLFTELQNRITPNDSLEPIQGDIEHKKKRMQAINEILHRQTVPDSAVWANQTLETIAKATSGVPVRVIGLKAPYHLVKYGEELIGEELILTGTFKDLNQVIDNLEKDIPGRINAVRIERVKRNDEDEKSLNLYINISAVLKNSKENNLR